MQEHQDIDGKLDKTEAASTYLTKTDASSTYLGKTAKAVSATSADSATKATQDGSGNVIISTYATKTELSAKGTYSKPSNGIPASDLASSVQASLGKADTALQGYTEKYTGTYTKPSEGIPSSDLSSDVRSALTKANSALQSETYKGTVTGVKINGATKSPSNGTVDLGTVITAHQDISGKADKSSLAAVATSGSYNDLSNKPTIPTNTNQLTNGAGFITSQAISGKQDTLVSGSNIKTINGQSVLGSGNITIEGGGDLEIPVVDHGTGDTTFVLTPNILHKWGAVTSLTFTLAVPTKTSVANYYMVQFASGTTATSLNLPDTIKWITEPNIEANKTYQISILDNLGVIGGA